MGGKRYLNRKCSIDASHVLMSTHWRLQIRSLALCTFIIYSRVARNIITVCIRLLCQWAWRYIVHSSLTAICSCWSTEVEEVHRSHPIVLRVSVLYVSLLTCLSLYLTVSHYLSLYHCNVTLSHCLSLYHCNVTVFHCLSLSFTVSHCLSLYHCNVTVSHRLSLSLIVSLDINFGGGRNVNVSGRERNREVRA